MAEVSSDFISALVLLARDENAADPCAWLQDLQKEVVADAIGRDDGRMRASSLNGKSVTFWLELSTDEKIKACAAACRSIVESDAEDADEAVPAFTNGRVRYVDYRYAGFS